MNLSAFISSMIHPSCKRQKCEDSGCCLLLDDFDPNNYILITMEDSNSPVAASGKQCDFIFFGRKPGCNDFWIAPIELTTGSRKSSELILDQLRAGAEVSDALIPTNADVRFLPIAAGPFGKYKRIYFRRRESMIEFRQSRVYLQAVECCSDLAAALSQ